ncbi:hypothetical protein NDU88_004619 [Pleurodeles waltl]|uniref:Uncharacterized protein n=1 Tax=Pleurodeles waltl TaxID=8319 RepID=A0AAV7TT36_PLEWA|nr:hypothetical protein NDU88_004619 [Pleurodeles waltl]
MHIQDPDKGLLPSPWEEATAFTDYYAKLYALHKIITQADYKTIIADLHLPRLIPEDRAVLDHRITEEEILEAISGISTESLYEEDLSVDGPVGKNHPVDGRIISEEIVNAGARGESGRAALPEWTPASGIGWKRRANGDRKKKGEKKRYPREAREHAGEKTREPREARERSGEKTRDLREVREHTGEKTQDLRDAREHARKKTRDLSKRRRHTGRKTLDPKQRPHKSLLRESAGMEEGGFARRLGEPTEEESTPDSHTTLLEERG